jgi:hypothetical protein
MFFVVNRFFKLPPTDGGMFCAPSGVDVICPPLRTFIETKYSVISGTVGRKIYRVLAVVNLFFGFFF